MLERNNFNRINITGRLKIAPNLGLRDAASKDRYDQRQSRSGRINSFKFYDDSMFFGRRIPGE
ncbi:MAG: hypothetical protein WBN75_17210 [Verrucomicrobiia bacterium]